MARFIMAGRLQAAGFVALFTLLPLLGLFSNAAIALVTLRKGWQEGLLLALVGSIALAIATYINRQDLAFGFWLAWIQYLPIVLIAWILYQTVSLKLTLLALLAMSVIGVIIFHVAVPDSSEFWLEFVKSMFKENPADPERAKAIKSLEQNLHKAPPVIAGIVAAVASISIAVSLLMARHWQSQLYNPEGFGKEFRELRLDKPVAILTALIIIIALVTGNSLAIEVLMCAMAIFLLQGIALIHALVKKLEMNQAWLVMMYVLLVLLNLNMAVLLAAIGIIDNFVDFRRQFIKK